VQGCPCAYVEGETFRDFLNELLLDEPSYLPTRVQDELVKFLTNYHPRECRNIVRDRDLLSFSDGVLVLSEARFVPNDAASEELQGRVARHHIDREFTGSEATSAMDRILSAQLAPEVAETLWAMIGRLLFRVGERDNWQVMPLLVGTSGTGKSVVLDGIAAMFTKSAVASVNKNHEQTFGLEAKLDCEVILGRDMPQQMSTVLAQELLQLMIVGEGISVPRKGRTAQDVTWTVPMVMASNFVFDYANTENQITRRLAVFRFRSRTADPDETLASRVCCEELPAMVARSLRAYLKAVATQKESGLSFWKWCPPQMLLAQREMASSMRRVHRTRRGLVRVAQGADRHVQPLRGGLQVQRPHQAASGPERGRADVDGAGRACQDEHLRGLRPQGDATSPLLRRVRREPAHEAEGRQGSPAAYLAKSTPRVSASEHIYGPLSSLRVPRFFTDLEK
jgi:hypothetical protein